MLDTTKYDELFGTKKEEVSPREATASNNEAMPTTSDNVPSTKSSSAKIVSQEVKNVNTADEITTPSLTDKCELYKTMHTKTGEALWVVTLKDKLSKEEYKELSGKVKTVGGYYSRFAKTPEGKAIPGFVFKTEPNENQIAVFNEFFDSQNKVLKNENADDIIETNTITENEVQDDGNVESRKTSENDERYSEMQSSNSGETVQDRSLDRLYTEAIERNERSGNRDISSRTRKIEERGLSEVIGNDSFTKLSNFVGDEITRTDYKKLCEKYDIDSRLDDGYDFSEIVAYDMLTDPNNELRILFADNIAEYFNESTDTTVDNTGEGVAVDILKATKNSVVKNKKGQLILVYHGTDKVFTLFKLGDIGFHFGSYYQAVQRVKANEVENPIFIRAYLNIENPLTVDEDFYGWNAF